jgi:signal transduction histidine kinase
VELRNIGNGLALPPEETRRALDAIEHAGEQALAEMRQLLGMLRSDDELLALGPQPGLTRIDELATRLTTTGLPVEVTIEGEPVKLPPGIDVSAYRIVQEASALLLKDAKEQQLVAAIRVVADGGSLFAPPSPPSDRKICRTRTRVQRQGSTRPPQGT